MKRPFHLVLPLILAVAVLILAACASGGSYETAPFKVTVHDGSFEIREYPSLKVVATRREGDDDSFMRLFRYIDGANESKEKVAMTTPVFMEGGEMRFVVPEKNRQGTPKPSSERVELRELPARTLVVYRFNGSRSDELEKESVAKLRDWMEARGLKAAGDPFFAYYNPPWTPGSFRHNEVLIPLVK